MQAYPCGHEDRVDKHSFVFSGGFCNFIYFVHSVAVYFSAVVYWCIISDKVTWDQLGPAVLLKERTACQIRYESRRRASTWPAAVLQDFWVANRKDPHLSNLLYHSNLTNKTDTNSQRNILCSLQKALI